MEPMPRDTYDFTTLPLVEVFLRATPQESLDLGPQTLLALNAAFPNYEVTQSKNIEPPVGPRKIEITPNGIGWHFRPPAGAPEITLQGHVVAVRWVKSIQCPSYPRFTAMQSTLIKFLEALRVTQPFTPTGVNVVYVNFISALVEEANLIVERYLSDDLQIPWLKQFETFQNLSLAARMDSGIDYRLELQGATREEDVPISGFTLTNIAGRLLAPDQDRTIESIFGELNGVLREKFVRAVSANALIEWGYRGTL